MSSRYKPKKEEDMILNLEEFFVYSWKEEEYLLAVQNDEFFSHSRLLWILVYRLIRLAKTWTLLNSTLRVLLQNGCFFLRPKL
jgi:hypothetical protein